jgi:cellulose 1,4-beta-cellobiosidase
VPPPADAGVALAPAPGGLAGTSTATVQLTWTAVTGATSYIVRRGTSATGTFTSVGTPTQPSFTDPTVSFATTYLYTVSAVTSAGEGAESNPVTVPVP